MKITKKMVAAKFGGRLPQMINEMVFVPPRADHLVVTGGAPIAAYYPRSLKTGRRLKRSIRIEEVHVDGYRYKLVVFCGKGFFCWIREDLIPPPGIGGISLKVVPWDRDIEQGVKIGD